MLLSVPRDGIRLLLDPALEEGAGVTVAFTDRSGGTSEGPFASLNLSYNVGDSRAAVLSNRRRVSLALGASPDEWTCCRQVHGASVQRVTVTERGRGARDYLSALPRLDGLVSTQPGAVLAVLTADCVPVVLVAGSGGAAGVAHAGWRGVLAGVVPAIVRELLRCSGGAPSDMLAYIGPHIRSCCFDVDGALAASFEAVHPGSVLPAGASGQPRVDLAAAVRAQLEGLGVPTANVVDAERCTVCGPDLFSFRRAGGLTGRQAAIAVIRGRGRVS